MENLLSFSQLPALLTNKTRDFGGYGYGDYQKFEVFALFGGERFNITETVVGESYLYTPTMEGWKERPEVELGEWIKTHNPDRVVIVEYDTEGGAAEMVYCRGVEAPKPVKRRKTTKRKS